MTLEEYLSSQRDRYRDFAATVRSILDASLRAPNRGGCLNRQALQSPALRRFLEVRSLGAMRVQSVRRHALRDTDPDHAQSRLVRDRT
jgi:hypothetical protein